MNDTSWNNTTVAESAWDMIGIVQGAQRALPLIVEGEPTGVLFNALEDLVAFATRNPDVMPAWLHERYCAFLRSKGFEWGETTDATKKRSRALVSWSSLSPAEGTEYAIFMGVITIITKGPKKVAAAAKKTRGPNRRKPETADAEQSANGAPAADDLVI